MPAVKRKKSKKEPPPILQRIFSIFERYAVAGAAGSAIILGLVALFVVVVRVRLLDLPFERDEGEFALMGKMILDGVPPYAETQRYVQRVGTLAERYRGVLASR